MNWSASDKLIKQIRLELEQLTQLVQDNLVIVDSAYERFIGSGNRGRASNSIAQAHD